MTLLTAGYFPANYFPSRYWQTSNQYWTEYGAAVSAPYTQPFERGMRVKRKRPVLPEDVLMLIRQWLELE